MRGKKRLYLPFIYFRCDGTKEKCMLIEYKNIIQINNNLEMRYSAINRHSYEIMLRISILHGDRVQRNNPGRPIRSYTIFLISKSFFPSSRKSLQFDEVCVFLYPIFYFYENKKRKFINNK